jgi:uncharacterized RDD family membrane protein YckC
LVVVWLRVAQFAVDLAIVAAAAMGAAMLMELLPKAPDGTYGNPVTAMLLFLVILAAVAALNLWYWIIRPVRHHGQTLAMSWFGLQVVPLAGTRATATQLALRMLLLAADGMFMGLVGLLAMLSNPKRQRLGDAVAQTVVLRTAPAWGRQGQAEPGIAPAQPRAEALPAAVAQDAVRDPVAVGPMSEGSPAEPRDPELIREEPASPVPELTPAPRPGPS